jgi:hypothetical protein
VTKQPAVRFLVINCQFIHYQLLLLPILCREEPDLIRFYRLLGGFQKEGTALTQTSAYSSGFKGEVPANLQCGFCKQPVQNAFYRTLNRFACQKCAMQIKGVIDKNVAHPAGLVQAGSAGLLAAIGCAAVWAAIVHITNYEIGIVASFIGVAVGKAVFIASGRRRGTPYQIVAGVLSAVGVLGGKIVLFGWQVYDYVVQKNIDASALRITKAIAQSVVNNPTDIFGGFDLLWTAFAVYAAWRICKAPPISIAGPFPLPAPSAAPLQFDTVEPNQEAEAAEEELPEETETTEGQ